MVAAVAAAEAAASTQKSSMLSGSGTGKEQKEQPGVVERLRLMMRGNSNCKIVLFFSVEVNRRPTH